MRIAIKAVQIAPGGGLTHLNKIIEWFGKLAPEIEFLLLAKKGQERLFIPPPDNFRYLPYKLPGLNMPSQIFWERQILPGRLRRMNADLLFEPGNRGTLKSPCPKVSLMHNVLPFAGDLLKNETAYNRLYIALLGRATVESMKASQGIIFISRASKEILARHVNIDSIKNTIIYHGKMETHHADNMPQTPVNLPARYILSVSHIHRYKKIKEMVGAYLAARNKSPHLPPLLIAGTNYAPQYMREIKEEIIKAGQADAVLFLGNVPENELGALYKNCEAFIFPSVLEACPNILIEALSCGCTIACSAKSVMPEIAEDAALYFDPDNVDEFSNKIVSIVEDKRLRQSLSEKARRRASFFSWEKTARETLEFFKEVIDISSPGRGNTFRYVRGQEKEREVEPILQGIKQIYAPYDATMTDTTREESHETASAI